MGFKFKKLVARSKIVGMNLAKGAKLTGKVLVTGATYTQSRINKLDKRLVSSTKHKQYIMSDFPKGY